MSFLKSYKSYFFALFSLIIYYILAYKTERVEFYKVVSLWTILFFLFFLIMKSKNVSKRFLFTFAILSRLVFLFSIPFLSQDFYRFIWDGRMLLEGFNPYLSLPETFIKEGNLPILEARELYSGMGDLNGGNYSNYPPLNQLIFFLGALFSNGSIIANIIGLRVILLLADIGIIATGNALLKKLDINPKNIFWYALNPFIIIEMTGNLHFETVMLFFLLWGIYQIHLKRWKLGAVLIACSISLKLIPLLFLPLFLNWFLKDDEHKKATRWFQLIAFYSIVAGVTIFTFLPFLNADLFANYSNSIGLWFRKFEFNASFYYIFRELGYLFRGFNEIAIIGKIIALLTILFTLSIALFRKNISTIQLLQSMLLVICFYLFVSTTVHPWYIATPLLLSVFTRYRFAVVWSFVVILSYHAYSTSLWQENLWLVFLQYAILFGYIFYETFFVKKDKMI